MNIRKLYARLALIFQSGNVKKIIANTSWMFADNILRFLVNIVVGIWLARHLGPFGYGNLNYAISFVGIFTMFASLGLNNIVIKDLVKFPAKKEEILGSAFFLKIFGGISSFLLSVVAIVLIKPHDMQTVILVTIIGFGLIFQTTDIIESFFQSQVKAKYSVWSGNFAFLLMAVLKVILILINAPLIYFAIASSGEILLAQFGYIWFYRKLGGALKRWRINLRLAKELLRSSWPVMLYMAFTTFLMKIDNLMVGNILGNTSLGYYAAAISLAEPWIFIPSAITFSVFPALVSSKKASELVYSRRLQKLYNFMTLAAVLIAIITTIFAKEMVLLFYGRAYAPAEKVLPIYVWAEIFVFLEAATTKWYLTEDLQKYALAKVFIDIPISIGLNLLLIRHYGLTGAAVAYVLTQLIFVYLLNAIFKKTRPAFFAHSRSLRGLFTPLTTIRELLK